jgi:pentatricopeptide repeat domain (PPR motif)
MSTIRSSVTILRRLHTFHQSQRLQYLSTTVANSTKSIPASCFTPPVWTTTSQQDRLSPPTTISYYVFERQDHRRQYNKRYFGSFDSQKVQNLYQECIEFLQQENLPESTTAVYHIVRLITELSKIWDDQDFNDSAVSIRPKSTLGENSYEKDMDTLRNVVDVVDKLAHVLLDIKAANMDDQKDRTKYGVTLSLALSFWTKCLPGKDNGIKAERILQRMEELGLFTETEEEGSTIRQISYGAVIQAYCITIDDPDGVANGAVEARRLLQKLESMQGFESALRIYNSCLHGFAIRGMVDEAEDLLTMLEERSKTNIKLTPDVLTYSACLNAYSKYTGREEVGKPLADRAEDILHRMMKRYDSTGDIHFRPNQYTFGTGKSFEIL